MSHNDYLLYFAKNTSSNFSHKNTLMKLLFSILSLLAVGTPVWSAQATARFRGGAKETERGLQESECTDCCTSIDALPFEDIILCDHGHIAHAISTTIGGTCSHNRDVEAQKLSGKTTNDEAYNFLMGICKDRIQGCTSLESLDFASIRDCHNVHWAKEEIRNKQVGCTVTRADWQEAIAITGTLSWIDAEAVLRESCFEKITPCIPYSDLVEGFKVASECSAWHGVHIPIQDRLGESCKRTREEEAVAIVWDREKVASPGTKVVWHDEDETTTNAVDYLVEKCKENIVPCTSLDALDFVNIRECSNSHWARLEIQSKQAGCAATTRADWQEAMLITNTPTWDEAAVALRTKCYEKITPCVQYTDLYDDMKVVGDCHSWTGVLNPIKARLTESCMRTDKEDAIAIVYNLEKDNNPNTIVVWNDEDETTTDAEDYLVAECESRITPCLDGTAALFDRFSSIQLCNGHHVLQDIIFLQGEACLRQAWQDAVLVSPDEYKIWHDNDPATLDAQDYMVEQCSQRITPCSSLDDLLTLFESVQSCADWHIRKDIESLQGEGCRRNPDWDGVILAKELLEREGSTEVPTRWWSDDPAEVTGYSALRDKCESIIKPCVELETLHLGFKTAQYCDANHVRHEIDILQDDECRRNPYEDAVLLTPSDYAIWGDDDLNTKDARIRLMNECSVRIAPSFQLSELESDFVGINICDYGHIKQKIEARQSTIASTRRNGDQDAILLAGEILKNSDSTVLVTTHLDLVEQLETESPLATYAVMSWGNQEGTYNPATLLQTSCEENIQPCVPSLDLIKFTNITTCSYGHIKEIIRNNQGVDCTRHPDHDAALIVRDFEWLENPDGPRPALRPIWDDDPNALSGSEYLVEMCLEEVESCVPSFDDLNFADIEYCTHHHITEEITASQPDTCDRHPHLDATFLVREHVYLNQDDPGYEPPVYVWNDNDPNTENAFDYLMATCENDITPCIEVEDLDFVNIENCNQHYVRAEIISKQEDCSSDRHPHHDAMIMTGTDVWYNEDPDVDSALNVLQRECEATIEACVSMETLDFRYIRSCDDHHIRALIDETRESIGDSCPSYPSRNVQDEAILITGADVYHDLDDTTTNANDVLIEYCLTKVESCTLKREDSLEVHGCDWINFKDAVRKGTRDENNDCARRLDFEIFAMDRELSALFGKTSRELLDETCTTAWSGFNVSTFDQVDSEFTPAFMDDYTNGLTHLNSETGNFQGQCTYDRNSEVGSNIAKFYMYDAKQNLVDGFNPLDTCQGQAIMCCFGRDRQFGDNNGNCHIDNCEDADPADNSNLCKTETRAYPNNDPPENEIHCHGLAWGADDNEYTRKLMFNNFFYVSLYDHMYSRGYVERTIRREDDPAEFRMCDCVEEMPPVSRADCTEVSINPFTVHRDATSGTVIATAPEKLDVQYNACRGDGRNNDLSAYIKRLVREERFSEALQYQAYQTLVGYENPNDNHNEAACDAIL